MKATNQIFDIIPKNVQNDIDKLFKQVDETKEFEFIFFSRAKESLNKKKYIMLLKYLRAIVKQNNYKLTGPEKSLDIALHIEDDQSNYRLSIVDHKNVMSALTQLYDLPNKNHLLFKFSYQLLKRKLRNDKDNYKFMNKVKDTENTVDIDDLSLRVRLATEINLLENTNNHKYHKTLNDILSGTSLPIDELNKINKQIVFRLKERTSVYIKSDDNSFIRIDVTDTKTSKNIKNIETTFSNYELEVEYGVSEKSKTKHDDLVQMYEICENLLKLVQQSSFLITISKSNEVIDFYTSQLGLHERATKLYARQSVSLEIQHVTDVIPNRYAVTDKADGDRHHMIIYHNRAYLMDDNLNVRDTGITLDQKFSKYNGTILDGEYIYLPKQKRHLFLAFDCLKNGDKILTGENKLKDRLEEADEVINDCFVIGEQKGFKFKEVPKQTNGFDIAAVRKFYSTELSRFYEHLDKDGEEMKKFPLVRRKYFMYVFGAAKWEIFDYSVEFWKKYTEDSTTKAPYLLDGLIYQPLDQNYNTNSTETKYHDYKWKPPVKNSIDFYVEFRKDGKTGKILKVYDNSDDEMVRNKTYYICDLYVGKSDGEKEIPVLFDQNYNTTYAYLYLDDSDEVRDINGDIISDKTVVEFYYKNELEIIPQRRWIPIKTRYDKTESVEKYRQKYGNYYGIAMRIWRSIINPVLMSDFVELAKGNTTNKKFYDIKVKEMNSKISHSLIVAATKENKYYQKQTKIAETMRQFHNFVKSNLIYTYCNKMYHANTQQSVLDIACGRGGDIKKFYYCEIAFYVGIDIDADGIKSPVDGALSRYNMLKKSKPNVPKMYFLQADASALLDYESQLKCLGGMEETNKKLLDKLFPTGKKHTLFDVINCQFAVHYFFGDRIAWENFKKNLNSHLRNGGYFIGTSFDANQVAEKFGENENITVSYDDNSGKKKTFFDIKKKYGSLVKTAAGHIDVGNAIDVFATWMFNDDNYFTEYLVDINFMVDELARDCSMELVDTDLFSNQYVVHRDFITDAVQFENVYETRKFLGKGVAEYYQDTEINKKSLEYSNLTRYFVFRKKGKTQTTGGKRRETGWNFSDAARFKIPQMENYDDQYSFLNSLHKILVSHKIIPRTVEVDEFMRDMKLPVRDDTTLDAEYITKLGNSLVIHHDISKTNKKQIVKALDGLNIFVVERDCNDFYDVEYWKTAGNPDNQAVVLIKEGTVYKPLLRKEEKGNKGLFDCKDEMIKYLQSIGSENDMHD